MPKDIKYLWTSSSHCVPSCWESQQRNTLVWFCMRVLREVELTLLHRRGCMWKSLAENFLESILEKCLHIFVLSTTRHFSIGHGTAWTFDLTWSSHSYFLNLHYMCKEKMGKWLKDSLKWKFVLQLKLICVVCCGFPFSFFFLLDRRFH